MTDASNPWALLRSRPWISLRWTDRLPPGHRGATDGRTIWLAHGLSQRERRCALMHELIHVELGHDSHQPPPIERQVEHETARRLLPDPSEVARVMLAYPRIGQASMELWVTDAVLRHRLECGDMIDLALRLVDEH